MLSSQLVSSKKTLIFLHKSERIKQICFVQSHAFSPGNCPCSRFSECCLMPGAGRGAGAPAGQKLTLGEGDRVERPGQHVVTVGMGTEFGECCAFRVRPEGLAGSRKSARSVTPPPWRERRARKPRGKQRREGAFGSSQDARHPDHGSGRFLRTLAWRLSAVQEHGCPACLSVNSARLSTL